LSDRARDVRGAAGRIILLLPLAVLLLSVALSPESNWIVRLGLAGFCGLAIVRPDAAFLATIALAGFGIILSHLAGVPLLRVTEVMVVGSIAGYCVRALPRGSAFRAALTDNVSMPIVLFAITVVGSTIVWLRVYQVQTTFPSAYLQLLLRFLTRDYFVLPGDFAVVVSAAVILEGLALYVVVAALCRLDATFLDRALRMLVVGGTGLAVMSVVRLGEIILRSPGALETMRSSAAGLRISPQIADYIAAGSYFSLCWLVALGMAIAASQRRVTWVIASVPLIAALYLTGSRSVIGAAIVGLVTLALLVARRRSARVRGIVVFAALVVALMVFSYRWMIGRDVAGDMARQSLTVRIELIRAGLEVIATRPLFGVGFDRFFLVAGGFASPELRALWDGRMNPHNDFLRFAGELGVIGLGLFVWILVEPIKRIWAALQKTRDPCLAGLAGGLVAFFVTSLVSNPLMVREVSYVFWFVLGLAVGYAAQLLRTGTSDDQGVLRPTAQRNRIAHVRSVSGLLLGSLLVVSIPFRARQEVAAVDLTHVTYGLFDWGTEPDGTPSRWSGPRARFFVDGRARFIEIPLSGVAPSGFRQQVEVKVDGRVVNEVSVGREWQRLRTLLPQDPSMKPRRIDLAISPSWVPAELIPGNQDRRRLGVKVGVIQVVGVAAQGR
jgi:O-antigen ligase